MLHHLIISTATLSVMMGAWYALQRAVQKDRTTRGIDFLRGRWGCSSCSEEGSCPSDGPSTASPGRHRTSG